MALLNRIKAAPQRTPERAALAAAVSAATEAAVALERARKAVLAADEHERTCQEAVRQAEAALHTAKELTAREMMADPDGGLAVLSPAISTARSELDRANDALETARMRTAAVQALLREVDSETGSSVRSYASRDAAMAVIGAGVPVAKLVARLDQVQREAYTLATAFEWLRSNHLIDDASLAGLVVSGEHWPTPTESRLHNRYNSPMWQWPQERGELKTFQQVDWTAAIERLMTDPDALLPPLLGVTDDV